ncbi:hypothetical protein U9M48_015543 [Paspalum notatum var. saurae]|uniref:Uncharacterized protein n=1 Tax=Paspalum notatum var. saurae TaxID=547442 RepID=A0AAQ3T6S8_PASNO
MDVTSLQNSSPELWAQCNVSGKMEPKAQQNLQSQASPHNVLWTLRHLRGRLIYGINGVDKNIKPREIGVAVRKIELLSQERKVWDAFDRVELCNLVQQPSDTKPEISNNRYPPKPHPIGVRVPDTPYEE